MSSPPVDPRKSRQGRNGHTKAVVPNLPNVRIVTLSVSRLSLVHTVGVSLYNPVATRQLPTHEKNRGGGGGGEEGGGKEERER